METGIAEVADRSMIRARAADVVFWAAILVALVTIGLFWANVEGLRSRVVTQQREIQQRDAALAAVDATIAQRKSQLLVAQDAFVANSDVLNQASDTCKSAQPSTQAYNICSALGVYWMKFVQPYNAAVSSRTSATDFSKVEEAYRDVVPTFGESNASDDWKARVLEGIAYAQFRQGKLQAARGQIDMALRLDPGSAFVNATALKIACANRAPASAIRESDKAVRDRLDKNYQVALHNSGATTQQRDTQLEKLYFDSDTELLNVCGYAGLMHEPG